MVTMHSSPGLTVIGIGVLAAGSISHQAPVSTDFVAASYSSVTPA